MSSLHVRVRVGGEAYAIPVSDVLEIADLGDIAPVPGASASILGVLNLRGQVLAVVDLARVLGLVRGAAAQRVVVAESDGRRAGLAVDAVDDVGELTEAEEAAESPHLRGTVMSGSELVGVVEVASVFDSIEPAATR
jgi:purine-binding chemotaxis protein CheW